MAHPGGGSVPVTAPAYARAPAALWHRTSRRVVVRTSPAAEPLDLDGVAALVWDALSQPVTLDELADDLAAVFERPVADVRPEVERLVAGLVAAGAAAEA